MASRFSLIRSKAVARAKLDKLVRQEIKFSLFQHTLLILSDCTSKFIDAKNMMVKKWLSSIKKKNINLNSLIVP